MIESPIARIRFPKISLLKSGSGGETIIFHACWLIDPFYFEIQRNEGPFHIWLPEFTDEERKH
jgi:hypothetical protein